MESNIKQLIISLILLAISIVLRIVSNFLTDYPMYTLLQELWVFGPLAIFAFMFEKRKIKFFVWLVYSCLLLLYFITGCATFAPGSPIRIDAYFLGILFGLFFCSSLLSFIFYFEQSQNPERNKEAMQ